MIKGLRDTIDECKEAHNTFVEENERIEKQYTESYEKLTKTVVTLSDVFKKYEKAQKDQKELRQKNVELEIELQKVNENKQRKMQHSAVETRPMRTKETEEGVKVNNDRMKQPVDITIPRNQENQSDSIELDEEAYMSSAEPPVSDNEHSNNDKAEETGCYTRQADTTDEVKKVEEKIKGEEKESKERREDYNSHNKKNKTVRSYLKHGQTFWELQDLENIKQMDKDMNGTQTAIVNNAIEESNLASTIRDYQEYSAYLRFRDNKDIEHNRRILDLIQ